MYENYSKFISATDTIRNMGRAMNSSSSSNNKGLISHTIDNGRAGDTGSNNKLANTKKLNGVHEIGGLEMMRNIRTCASEITTRVSSTDNRLRKSRIRIEELSSIRKMLHKMILFASLPTKIKKVLSESRKKNSGGGGDCDDDESVTNNNNDITTRCSRSESRSRILLASKYIIDAMPIVRLVLPLPVPMAASARELITMKQECEDELIKIISGEGGDDDSMDAHDKALHTDRSLDDEDIDDEDAPKVNNKKRKNRKVWWGGGLGE